MHASVWHNNGLLLRDFPKTLQIVFSLPSVVGGEIKWSLNLSFAIYATSNFEKQFLLLWPLSSVKWHKLYEVRKQGHQKNTKYLYFHVSPWRLSHRVHSTVCAAGYLWFVLDFYKAGLASVQIRWERQNPRTIQSPDTQKSYKTRKQRKDERETKPQDKEQRDHKEGGDNWTPGWDKLGNTGESYWGSHRGSLNHSKRQGGRQPSI